MAETEKKKKSEYGAESVNLTHLDSDLEARLAAADRAASGTNDSVTAAHGSARLREANADVEKSLKVGPSTYSAAALELVVDAIGLGFLNAEQSALLSQMAKEIQRGELDVGRLPIEIRTYLGL